MTGRKAPRKPPPPVLPDDQPQLYYAGAYDALHALMYDDSGDPWRALKWACIEASQKYRAAGVIVTEAPET